MAIPIHSNFLLFVAAEAFFCIRLHVGPQLSCCSGMVGWFFTADPACRAAITAFARRSPFRPDASGRPNHSRSRGVDVITDALSADGPRSAPCALGDEPADYLKASRPQSKEPVEEISKEKKEMSV